LNHHEKGIEKGTGHTFFVYGVVKPRGSLRLCPPILFNLIHRSGW